MVIATCRKCQLCKKAKVTNQKYASQMQLGVFGRDAILNVKHITGLIGNILDNGNKPESIKTTSARTNLDAFINTNDRNRLLRRRNDLDTIMISAAHAGKSKGVDPAHLSKIWKIDLKTAERTLDVVSQNNKRTNDPKLSRRNYGTNDRMLQYRRVTEYFFMDTFFATKKAGKSSRGHTCCQLFVTHKGFVYVIPMKSKAEVLQAVKQFAKEIGAPDAIICDMAGKQTSHALKRFCQEISTSHIACSGRRNPVGKQDQTIHWVDKGGGTKGY